MEDARHSYVISETPDILNMGGCLPKRRSGRALTARRQTIWRRVLRHGALRAVGGKSRRVVCSALFERVFTWFYGDAGGSVLSLPELNWRYAIRRRVGGNAGFYLGMS